MNFSRAEQTFVAEKICFEEVSRNCRKAFGFLAKYHIFCSIFFAEALL